MLHDFIRLARPFWTSEERGKAWATLALLTILTLASVGVSVMLVQLAGAIFDAIQNYDLKAFLRALEFWSLWALFYCGLYVYQSYVSMALTIRWRRWMTAYFLQQWMQNKAFYFWQISGQPTDNPDQRISEDIRDFVGTNDTLSGAVPLALGVLQQVATLLAFVALLWKVGGTLFLLHGHLVRSRLSGLVRSAVCRSRLLADGLDRLSRHRAQFQSAALRGGFPVQPSSPAREQ